MFEINPFPNVKSSRMSKTSRAKSGILAATEEYLLAAMALNLKRMVNAIFRYLQIYCSAGTTVGFSRIFAFVNRSLIVHYLWNCPPITNNFHRIASHSNKRKVTVKAEGGWTDMGQ